MKSLPISIISILLIVWAEFSLADDLVVVSNKEVKQDISRDDIVRIYLGKQSVLPDGSEVEPLDINAEHPNYEAFAEKVLKKSRSQLRAYWAKQIFTGRGTPPKSRKTDKELVDAVKSDKKFIAYISEDNKEEELKVILDDQDV